MAQDDSTGKLDSVETNPLPHVSSARAWEALDKKTSASRPLIALPKSTSVFATSIREKAIAPKPPRRLRADGTEEICADDIMLIVPAPEARAKAASSEELGEEDLEIEVAHAEPEFHPPAYSIHATQEILADDVLEVVAKLPNVTAPAPQPRYVPQQQEERPSSVPPAWTVDAPHDEFEFPTPPQYTGQHAAISARITAFSATQVFRRRSANMKVVIASVSLAATLMMVAGIARLMPSSSAQGSDGPVGISIQAPKKLDTAVRGRVLAFGKATHVTSAPDVTAVSIDSLPETHNVYRRRR